MAETKEQTPRKWGGIKTGDYKPKVFIWRSYRYEWDKLTRAQIEKLADDKEFPLFKRTQPK